MNDEPERFTPPRPAIPVRTKQEQRVADAERDAEMRSIELQELVAGKKTTTWERSQRARKAWQTRRANATVKSTPARKVGKSPLLAAPYGTPDRHRPAVFTAKEAVELARLMVDYPFLRKLVE